MINKVIEHRAWQRLKRVIDHESQLLSQEAMNAVDQEMLPILREIIAMCRLRKNSANTLAAHSLAYDILQLLAPWDEVYAEEIDELAFRVGDENE